MLQLYYEKELFCYKVIKFKELNPKQKIKQKYILRRVGFLLLILLLIIIIISIIITNSISVPESMVASEITGTPPIMFKATEEPKKIVKTRILIYHTHNDEAFYKGSYLYKETDIGRSFDENYNIIAVGHALKNNLQKYNKFDVIHDKSDNVSEGFDYAYDTSYKNIKKYIGKTDLFIDVHRDAYAESKSNYVFGNFNKEYAYIRFVVANGNKYEDKPNFESNYSLAEKLNNELNLILPGISKGIIKKNARLNQHVSESCLLIEIGNEKNDIKQVINSTEILAQALYNIS